MHHFDLRTLFQQPTPDLHLLDAGAFDLGDPPPYQPLLAWPETHLFGFEPNEKECARLVQSAGPNRHYWPVALGDGKRHRFHVGRSEATSSLLQPNIPLASKYRSLAEHMETTREFEIDTTRLDDIGDLPALHYLKMDVQGAELMILEHGVRQLASTLVLHLEVEFVPLYVGQPLFGDVDVFLRKQGFQFHRFASLTGRTVPPFLVQGDPHKAMSQLLWGDALYIRDLETLEELPTEQLIRMALLLHELYRSYDVASLVVQEVGRRLSLPLMDRYLQGFATNQVTINA